jgi:hypothetical protein
MEGTLDKIPQDIGYAFLNRYKLDLIFYEQEKVSKAHTKQI